MSEELGPPSLTSLPGEILMAIVACLGPSRADYDEFSNTYRPDVGLYRVASTCKALRDIATPTFYEICDLKTASNFHRSWRILHMLAARPDIASQVKRVIVDGSFAIKCYPDNNRPSISAQDAALFNPILQAKLDMTTVAPLGELQETDEPDYDECAAIGKSLACVALALVPNVTSVIFYSHYASLGSFKAGSFPLLEAFSLQHADSELSAHFKDSQGLLAAAPNVKRFIGYAIDDMPTIAYPSITQVVLSFSSIREDAILRLPTAFPNLERFTLTDGGTYVGTALPASPRGISQALLGLSKTLTHVEIRCEVAFEDMWMGFDHDKDGLVESLSQMQALQSLRLPALMFDPHRALNGAATMTLVDFLPTSIRSLYVSMHYLDSSQVPGILALAQAAPGKFPNLTKVAFPLLHMSLHDTAREAYAESGVACSFKETPVNTYGCYFD